MTLLRQPTKPKRLPLPPVIRPGSIVPEVWWGYCALDESPQLNAVTLSRRSPVLASFRAAARVRVWVQTKNRTI